MTHFERLRDRSVQILVAATVTPLIATPLAIIMLFFRDVIYDAGPSNLRTFRNLQFYVGALEILLPALLIFGLPCGVVTALSTWLCPEQFQRSNEKPGHQ